MLQIIGDFIAEKINRGSTNGEEVYGTATEWMVKKMRKNTRKKVE